MADLKCEGMKFDSKFSLCKYDLYNVSKNDDFLWLYVQSFKDNVLSITTFFVMITNQS